MHSAPEKECLDLSHCTIYMYYTGVEYCAEPDGNHTTKTSRWKSAWDLTERQKEKLQQKDEKEAADRKAKKKRKKSLIAPLSQGILELMSIGDAAVSGDNRHLKSFANKTNTNNVPNKVSMCFDLC